MNINVSRAKDFERMMTQTAKVYGCDISFQTNVAIADDPEKSFTHVTIRREIGKQQMHRIVWDEVPSLTDAAVSIWASWFEYYYAKTKPSYVPYSDMMNKYIQNDVEITKEIAHVQSHSIKNVIFNDPATIVFWHDGTKTVVKCDETDIFDPEKGLAMAISKKFLGNQGNYYNEIRKWVGADLYMNEKTHNDLESLFDNITVDALAENMRNLLNRLEGRK